MQIEETRAGPPVGQNGEAKVLVPALPLTR